MVTDDSERFLQQGLALGWTCCDVILPKRVHMCDPWTLTVAQHRRVPGGVLAAYAAIDPLGTVDIWGWRTFCGGGCPVHYGVFVPGLYPLGASSTPRRTQRPLLGAKFPGSSGTTEDSLRIQ